MSRHAAADFLATCAFSRITPPFRGCHGRGAPAQRHPAQGPLNKSPLPSGGAGLGGAPRVRRPRGRGMSDGRAALHRGCDALRCRARHFAGISSLSRAVPGQPHSSTPQERRYPSSTRLRACSRYPTPGPGGYVVSYPIGGALGCPLAGMKRKLRHCRGARPLGAQGVGGATACRARRAPPRGVRPRGEGGGRRTRDVFRESFIAYQSIARSARPARSGLSPEVEG